jgi:glycosyltransferase involved in cell wall biosynthesis
MRHPVGRQTSVIARSYLNRVAQCNLGCNLELVHELAPALAALDSSGTAEAPARILFLSTNEAWGGSEVAVARAALHFAEEGYRVALCMRRFSSRPVLLDHITQDGKVTVFERDCLETFGTDATESFVLSFAADLLYLSNGHAFEGLDIMRWATEHDLPYVNFIPLPNDAMRQFQTDDSFAECRDLLKGSRAILLDHTPAKRQMDCLFNCSFRNLHVVRNDYDVSYDLPFTWPFEKAPKTFDIGFFGRMDCEHKGLDLLLGVLSMKKWITRPLRVLLYGQGPDLEWTREQIRQNRLESVLLKGYTDSLEHSLTAVQGIVMPSRMEGTPIALVDALLCHRMAIVTPVGGMPELVKDGVSGFIAKEASVEALDDCLERAWNRRQAWASMGKAAGEGVRRIVPAKPHLQAVDIIAPLVRLKEVSA